MPTTKVAMQPFMKEPISSLMLASLSSMLIMMCFSADEAGLCTRAFATRQPSINYPVSFCQDKQVDSSAFSLALLLCLELGLGSGLGNDSPLAWQISCSHIGLLFYLIAGSRSLKNGSAPGHVLLVLELLGACFLNLCHLTSAAQSHGSGPLRTLSLGKPSDF